MFNKLQEAIALAELQELEETAIIDILAEEMFDESIDLFLNKEINILIAEDMEMCLTEDEELDDMLEDEEEEEEVELEDLLESVFEGF